MDMFETGKTAASEPVADITVLHAKIGQLTLECDFHMACFFKQDERHSRCHDFECSRIRPDWPMPTPQLSNGTSYSH